jgi:hypothetical protein
VTPEQTGVRELTKFVTNHIFGDEHIVELPSVMNRKRKANKFWDDRAST